MTNYLVNYSKRGQLKIQEMAFVLVAIMVFFAMASLFYFAIKGNSLQKEAVELKEEQAKELVKKIAVSAEFVWKEDCANCIDLDKLIILKDRKGYKGFWDLDYLVIERVYPDGQGECTRGNYPNCKTITLENKQNYGTAFSSYVALCRYEFDKGGYEKCELGKIYAAGKGIE